MAVDNRKLDVKDILTKVTTGWIAPPTEPELVMISTNNPLPSELASQRANGTIAMKKNYSFRREKLSRTRENRVWEFPISIIGTSEVNLQGLFDQAREVFDRYTSSPWATGTLGTGTTYDYAGIEAGDEDERLPAYVMDATVFLAEYIVPVVIA